MSYDKLRQKMFEDRQTYIDEQGDYWAVGSMENYTGAVKGIAIDKLADLENKIENGTLIELPCSDCDVFIKTYRIIKDCSFCAFSLDGDHAPYCKFDDGRKRICQYQIADMYILIDKLKGDEYLSYTQAKNECDRLNYIYACAIKNYLDEYPYEDDIANIVNSITKAEAEKRLKEFSDGKV